MGRRLPKCLFSLGVSLASALVVLACRAGGEPPLRVLAAASLTDVALELAERYAAGRVEVSIGSSSALARQIRDGASGDLFLSASPEWMDYLEEENALESAPVVLARNQLACVARRGSPLAAAGARDPASLLEALGANEAVAIADEGVPAGEYARSALRALGLLTAYRPHLVGQRDVRAALHAVERGELAAGFVYLTDAQPAAVEVLFVFEPAKHPRIEYQVAVLRGAKDPGAAHRFLHYLRGETARALFADAGFVLP